MNVQWSRFARPAKALCAPAFALLPGLLVSGCVVGPAYKAPAIDVPSRFGEPTGSAGQAPAASLGRWWQSFRDPLLASFVERATARNLDVELAASRIREARQQELASGAGLWPRVDAQAQASRIRPSEHLPLAGQLAQLGSGGGDLGNAGLPGKGFDLFRAGFDASWELDLFGGKARAIEAARARTESLEWSRRDVEITIAAEVASDYLTYRDLEEQEALAAAEDRRQARLTAYVAERIRLGYADQSELAKQQAAQQAAGTRVAQLHAGMRLAIHSLSLLTGESTERLSQELEAPAPSASPPEVAPGIPSELLRRRADIRAAERTLAASTADIGVAVADLYPKFSLTGAFTLVSTGLSSLLSWGSRNVVAGGGASWPVFDAGRGRAEVGVARERREQAYLAYRKAILTALKDVDDALSRCQSDRDQAKALEERLAAEQRGLALARSRRALGLSPALEQMEVEGRVLAAQSALNAARASLARNTVGLFKALGGGWEDRG